LSTVDEFTGPFLFLSSRRFRHPSSLSFYLCKVGYGVSPCFFFLLRLRVWVLVGRQGLFPFLLKVTQASISPGVPCLSSPREVCTVFVSSFFIPSFRRPRRSGRPWFFSFVRRVFDCFTHFPYPLISFLIDRCFFNFAACTLRPTLFQPFPCVTVPLSSFF